MNIVSSWKFLISMTVLLCNQSNCYLFSLKENSLFNSTKNCLKLLVIMAYYPIASSTWKRMFSSTVVKTRREVFQLSCGKIYFHLDNLLNSKRVIWSGKVSLVPEFLEISTSYSFDSFQARFFLDQFHVEFSINKAIPNFWSSTFNTSFYEEIKVHKTYAFHPSHWIYNQLSCMNGK